MIELKTKMCTRGVINESPEERELKEKLMTNHKDEEPAYNPLKETED